MVESKPAGGAASAVEEEKKGPAAASKPSLEDDRDIIKRLNRRM